MDVFKAILGRRSVREWKKDKPIPRAKIGKLKKAVEWAPSAHNLQSRFFYFVSDKRKIAELCLATGRQFEPVMPLMVVACADYSSARSRSERRAEELYVIMDVSASVENLLLCAHAEGLGGVWVGSFDEEKAREILGIPQHLRPIVLVPLGFPAEKPKPHARKTQIQEVR